MTSQNQPETPPPLHHARERVRCWQDPEDPKTWWCLEHVPCNLDERCSKAPGPDLHGPYWYEYVRTTTTPSGWWGRYWGRDTPHNPIDVDRSPEALDRLTAEVDQLIGEAGTNPTEEHNTRAAALRDRMHFIRGSRTRELLRQLEILQQCHDANSTNAMYARRDELLSRGGRLTEAERAECNRLCEITDDH